MLVPCPTQLDIIAFNWELRGESLSSQLQSPGIVPSAWAVGEREEIGLGSSAKIHTETVMISATRPLWSYSHLHPCIPVISSVHILVFTQAKTYPLLAMHFCISHSYRHTGIFFIFTYFRDYSIHIIQ